MPKTTAVPGNALYDHLRDTGRTVAGMAQQQTQTFQDWTRPSGRVPPVIRQTAQAQAVYTDPYFTGGTVQAPFYFCGGTLTDPLTLWDTPPIIEDLLVACIFAPIPGWNYPTSPINGWTIGAVNGDQGIWLYRYADGSAEDTMLEITHTLYNGGYELIPGVLCTAWDFTRDSVDHTTPILGTGSVFDSFDIPVASVAVANLVIASFFTHEGYGSDFDITSIADGGGSISTTWTITEHQNYGNDGFPWGRGSSTQFNGSVPPESGTQSGILSYTGAYGQAWTMTAVIQGREYGA